MKLYKIFFILVLCFMPFLNAESAIKLTTPYDLETKQLNTEEKDKLQSINYSQTVGIPDNQYKGKLKHTKGKEDVYLKDVGLYFGGGGRFTMAKDTKIEYEDNTKTNVDLTSDFNYFASVGLYWRNGIRTEFEYSEAAIKGDTDATLAIKKKDGTYTTIDNTSIHLLIRTYMLNFIFENVNVDSPVKSYFGFGGGVVTGNMRDFLNTSKSNVPGCQIMAGLSYPISDGIAAIYLGYRFVIAAEMEQTFVKTNGTTDADVKGKYNYQSHNVDLGLKFFF